MCATYMLLWKKDGGENNLQPFSPTTIIVTIYNITDIATTTTIVEDSIIFFTGCRLLTTLYELLKRNE